MMKRLGRVDHGFVDINAMALNAAISASILAALKVYWRPTGNPALDAQSGAHPLVPSKMP
jgi:hypothetical protein